MQFSVAADVERLHNAVSSEFEQIMIRGRERGVLYTRCGAKNSNMSQLLKIAYE